MSDDELTPSEKRALETLPKESMPSADLENRVVSSLRERGVLLAHKRRVIQLNSLRIAGVAAAALFLVIGGFTMGFWASNMNTVHTSSLEYPSGDLSAAASLQRAGTAYLLALEELAALPDSTHGDEMLQGREVALRTLYTATDRVTKIVPKRYLAGQLLQVIQTSEDNELNNKIRRNAHQAIWF